MSQTVEVVIASFKEDLRWIKWIPESWNHRVYCTAADRKDLPEDSIILPNVAREAGQYLEHIVRNYDWLADVTLFLQGMPFDHSPWALIEILLSAEIPTHPICYVGAQPPPAFGSGAIPFFDGTKAIMRKAYAAIGRDGETGKTIPFTVGAQFYVRREVVHALPLEFYKRLLEACSEPDTQPGFAHLIEGSWGCAFDWETFI